MLNLPPGNYQGAASGIISANGLLIGFTDYTQAQTASMHTHENAHLSMGLNGQMVVHRKPASGIKSNVEPLSYVHAGEEHQTVLLSTIGKNINIELEQQFFLQYELAEENFSNMAASPGASLIMLKVFKELHFPVGPGTDNIHALLLSMIQPQLLAIKKSPPEWVRLVKEMLTDNWDQDISLKELAFVADLHPVTLSKYFPRYFCCSLGEYRRGLKVERALRLMNSSRQSLTEIAHRCGFFDQSHFIRAFREATGYSPKRFHPHLVR